MKSTLVDGLPYHATMRHPHSGQRLRALAIVNGAPLWPMFGSDGDDDKGDGDKTDADADTDKDDAGDDKADKDKDKKPAVDPALAKLQEDFDKIKKQLSESDKKKSAAEKKLSELESKDLSDLEKAKKDLKEKTDRETELGASFKKLALDNAFLKASQAQEINWHDPEIAALKLGSLEVGDDGTVEGMADAVKKLAKASPFLVKAKKTEDDTDKKDKDTTKKGASGSGVGSGQNGGKGKENTPDREELYRRFPALRK